MKVREIPEARVRKAKPSTPPIPPKGTPPPTGVSSEEKAADKMRKRIFQDEQPTGRFSKVAANLPLVSAIPDEEDMQRARVLLERGHEIKERMDSLEKQLREVKDALVGISQGYGMEKGFRYGGLAASISQKSRATLSKELLVENGVDPDVISKSMKEGEPYWEVRLDKILVD